MVIGQGKKYTVLILFNFPEPFLSLRKTTNNLQI
jgi:hypothetical protein